MSVPDDALRARALGGLGIHAPPLAREALEDGTLEVDAGVLAWEGSFGPVQGDRVVLTLDPELRSALDASPAATDALTAAVAAAVGIAPGRALAELRFAARIAPPSRSTSPYRGRL